MKFEDYHQGGHSLPIEIYLNLFMAQAIFIWFLLYYEAVQCVWDGYCNATDCMLEVGDFTEFLFPVPTVRIQSFEFPELSG